mmetsp:Transcript_29682/g.76925  ORF Transcript_29682/g.76925 Transcript_29682/m.76925 type:complete len:280 (+) Transcript_29682:1089-1928(+)
MPQQRPAVPLQEEPPVLCVPGALVRKELSLLWVAAVAACIVRPSVAPVRVACLPGSLSQRGESPAVIALELPHAWELPPVRFHIGRVAKLPTGTRADEHFLYQGTQLLAERVPEVDHEIFVALHWRAAHQHALRVISPNRQVLSVALAKAAVPRPIRKKEVRVMVTALQHPWGQRNLCVVTHIAAACMESQDDLCFQPCLLNDFKQLLVATPVVGSRLPLNCSPPYVHSHAMGTRLSKQVKRLSKPGLVCVGEPTRCHRIQGEHRQNGASSLPSHFRAF